MQSSPDMLFTALADPTRRAIFQRLTENGEQTVWMLTAPSGVSQPAISKPLGILKNAGLVADRRDGRQTHYSARPEALRPLVDWIGHYSAFWSRKFDALEDILKRMDQ